jgi:dolichol-phosphate mannosyltransferase
VPKLLSVVVPAYNEEECVDELATRLGSIADSLSATYTFEFIIVENGSIDSTFARLVAIRDRDPRVKIIRLSRNFGAEGAVTAALRHATGDAAIIMSADLQDPPEMLPRFIELWEKGFANVYGRIDRRTDESPMRQRLTRAFYWLVNRANAHPVPENVSDFRLVDRKLYETLNAMPERNRMLRTMWGWIGYSSVAVPYVRPPRFGGRSTYATFRNIVFALHGIAASSGRPLRLIPIASGGFAVLALIGLTACLVRAVIIRQLSGLVIIVVMLLGLFGLLFMLLSVLSEYIGIIFDEVRARPSYIVSEAYGVEPRQPDRG